MKEKIKIFIKSKPLLYRKSTHFYYYLRYLFFRFILKKRFNNFYLNENCQIVNIPVKDNSFFGYYNISPFNNKGELLWCETSENRIRGSKYSPIRIIYYNTFSNFKKVVSESIAWNWQQGCMLQWYANSDDKIIYNNYDEIQKEYFSEIYYLKSNKTKRICKPIYSVAGDGSFALTLNFDRNTIMRPCYGYFKKEIIKLPDDSNDGIWFIDIEKNTSRLLLSLENLKKFKPHPTMINSNHKVNHIDIAPDGKRFMFLHRWIGPKGRFHRLLTANCKDGTELSVLTGNELVSHNCWMIDSKNIISFSRLKDGRDRYNYYTDKKGFVKIIGENTFLEDGHPSNSPDGRWMLTDDYPDKARFSRLYLFDLINKEKYIIGEFYQPIKYQAENRIDLHPKWDKDGKFVSIDSGHQGKREFYVIDVSKITSVSNK
jgi:hypothetical protein